MSTLWENALHNACGPTPQSGQRSPLARMNVSKGVAHRGENPGGQYAHTVQAVLGQRASTSRDLHADHRAAEQPTAALSRHLRGVTGLVGGIDWVFASNDGLAQPRAARLTGRWVRLRLARLVPFNVHESYTRATSLKRSHMRKQ